MVGLYPVDIGSSPIKGSKISDDFFTSRNGVMVAHQAHNLKIMVQFHFPQQLMEAWLSWLKAAVLKTAVRRMSHRRFESFRLRLKKYGDYSLIGKTVNCGFTRYGFESH